MHDRSPFAATRRSALLGFGAATVAVAAGPAAAQQWPTRPIRILVGYPAGGANDLVARLEGEGILVEITGQIRNRRFRYQSYIDLFSDLTADADEH